MSYGSSYKPARINSSNCRKCPEPAIVVDSNNNDKTNNTLLKTKKEKCAYVLKNGFNRKNLFINQLNGLESNLCICKNEKEQIQNLITSSYINNVRSIKNKF